MLSMPLWQRIADRPAARHGRIGGIVRVEGGQIHFLTDGPATPVTPAGREPSEDTTPIVLLHGASGNLRDMALSLLPLLARNHRVIALDRPGFGHSSPVANGHLLSSQVRILRRAIRRLGHYRFHLVGHSFSGALALNWALAYPDEVASLGIVSGATMDWGGALEGFYRLSSAPGIGYLMSHLAPAAPERMIRSTLEDIFHPAAVPAGYRRRAGIELALRPRTFRLNTRSVNALHAQIRRQIPSYSGIASPTAVIHGVEDCVIPAGIHARPLSEALPNARLTLIPGAGHMPHHTHTERVAAALEAAIT
ncbi:MAG: alpha/beta fold hydrolase [Pseudomonadota bacterium]